ncbi:Putative disease resistance protein RGA4 [Linum perenne]
MYDADDLLDDLYTEARRQEMAPVVTCWSMVCFLFYSLPKQLIYELKMAHNIKAIREKLDDITKDKVNLHLEIRFEEALPSTLPSRETGPCPPTIVVGREDDTKNIIELLLDAKANNSVVSIVGIGGLGKTTLAQLVFDANQVKDHFDTKTWVYVSESFDVKVILGKMIQSLTLQTQAGLQLDVLQAQLLEQITGKRYLFVLDDVWNETAESWEELGKCLMVGAPGSKVLVTTRSTKVAEATGKVLKLKTSSSVVLSYHLQVLSIDESWDLMVAKAGGEKDLPKIAGDRDPIMSTLQLSYYQLPSPVKRCFLYCKLFPKGCRLDVQRLVWYWIAQGYIESEEVGFLCSRMLWWRSFFQDVEIDELGNMSTCRMHDFMYDLAESLTGTKFSTSCHPTIVKRVPPRVRHLAVLGQDGGIVQEAYDGGYGLIGASKVRTLVSDKQFSKEECQQIVNNFRCVRVLTMTMKDFEAYGLLNYVGRLKHLRYLGISFDFVVDLPDCVSDIINLQVLDLSKLWNLRKLPKSFGKLVNLKHLLLVPKARCLIHMPKGIGELKLLQTLPIFVVYRRSNENDESVEAAGLEELGKLDALRGELVITNLEYAKFLGVGVCVLKNKKHLQSLVLDWTAPADWCRVSTNAEEILEITLCPPPSLQKLEICGGYGGLKIPNWLANLSYLVEFSLKDCKECHYFPPLHQLPSLKKLQIKSCPRLKTISFSYSSTATGEEEEENEEWPCFISLANLSIEDCPNLTRIPTFPTLDGQLELAATSLEPLEKTMKMIRAGDGFNYTDEYTNRALSKLTKLTLRRIGSLDSLPEDGWSSLSSLQELMLYSIIDCVKLPNSLCSITSLTNIYISSWSLEFLPPLHLLPSLSKLVIEQCPELKGWWKKGCNGDDDDRYYYCSSSSSTSATVDEEEEEEGWPRFPCLSQLRIIGCPKLTQMPLFPTVKAELELTNTSSQALLRTMKMKVAASSSSSSSCSLSNLTYLVIKEIDDLESLPEECFANLTSLRVLKIVGCRRLASLPRAIRLITSLKRLEVRECPLLTARLIEGCGEDWTNISHIAEKQVY